MPGRTEARTISYKEVDSVSESSELSSEDEEDQEFEARLEASGAPLVRRKRTKKKSKSSDKSRKRRRQKGSPSRASNSTENDDAEEDDAPCSGDDGSGEGAAEGASGEAETLQAANPFEKLPFELFCEIFSYLDLGDLIQLTRTSHYLNGMLLAPSAQSIWSRSRRNAGYVLFPGMSEIRFAVTMEGSLCQYCGAEGVLEMVWMARLCKDCKQRRVGAIDKRKGFHGHTFSCVGREETRRYWSSDAEYAYSYKELDTVNKALLEAQAADNAEIAARLANGFPEYAKRPPSHVQRYVADRERLLADREEARQVNKIARYALMATQRRELLERRKLAMILHALQDRHGLTLRGLAELEVNLFREPEDEAFARGMPDVPLALPEHAPLAWTDFIADFFTKSKKARNRDHQREETVRLRAECVRSSYEACGPALALEFCMPVDALPTWDHLKEAPEVEALCRLPLTFLQAKPSAEYQPSFARTVENDRMVAIRYALAAQLDVSVEELSCDPDDYPATTYDKFFFERLINRFEVGRSEYLTYYEALAKGYTAMAVSKMTRASWRRAITHVLRTAEIKDTESSLSKLDALGAGFRWTNAPPGYKGRTYNWRKMVDLLLREGPTGLHLADLQNVQLAYKCPGAADETDQNASLPAKDLAATEEKTATSSRSGLLMTNDMDADNTTANASMSESSCRTAAAAAAAAPTIGLPRSTRLAHTL